MKYQKALGDPATKSGALREQKAYREAFSHQKAIEIMQDMANNKKIDESIVDIFDKILA